MHISKLFLTKFTGNGEQERFV